MALQRTRSELRQRFQQGAKPSQSDFHDLIESNLNLKDDPLVLPEDPDKPICFKGVGDQSFLIDFADKEGNNTWRFFQKPLDSNPGFHVTTTSGASRLYLEEATGKVGLGTSNPEANLQLQGSQETSLRIFAKDTAGNASLELRNSNSSYGMDLGYQGEKKQLVIKGYNNSQTPKELLSLSEDTGNLNVSGIVTATKFIGDGSQLTNLTQPWQYAEASDIRLKNQVVPLGEVLEKIKSLQGVSYCWNEHELTEHFPKDKRQIGLIADEVEKVFPELVVSDKKGFKHLEYAKLTAVLLEGMKCLMERLDKLEK